MKGGRRSGGDYCRAGLLTLTAVLLAGAFARGAAGEAESRGRARLEQSFLVVQFPAGTQKERLALDQDQLLRPLYGDGARIIAVAPDGSVRTLTSGFHSACDPDVSYDGTRFLFAGKRSAAEAWNIFELTLDGSTVRQVTRDLGDCRSPGYQSSHYQISVDAQWDQITFVRIDAGTLNESGTAAARSLYTCRDDGTLARRITYNLSSDFDPTILWDGRLLYSAWRRRNLEFGPAGRIALLDMNTDGTDYAPFVVETGKRIKHMSCSTPQGVAVFVESDRMEWDGAGTLGSVSLWRPLHSYRALSAAADGLFVFPASLPDETLLVSRRPADGSGTHAVCRFDPQTKRTVTLLDDPLYHDIQARLVAARTRPDGRSSSMDDSDPRGILYCLNVHRSDQTAEAWLPPSAELRLRVVEGVPRERRPAAGSSPAAALTKLAARRVLGEIPVDADGSFKLELPANTPIELQLVGADGVALRSCGWVWTRNHFNQGCVGCHEDPELTPENLFVSALDRPAVPLGLPGEERKCVSFSRDILPIVAAKCVPCHGTGGSPPLIADSGSRDPFAVYLALIGIDGPPETASPRGKFIHPGTARTSPLTWHMFNANTSRPWDGEWVNRPWKPIPPDSPVQLSEAERRTIVEWIDLGAAFDDPPTAVDTSSPSPPTPSGKAGGSR